MFTCILHYNNTRYNNLKVFKYTNITFYHHIKQNITQFVIYCQKQDILYRFSEYYLYFSIRISSFYVSNRSPPSPMVRQKKVMKSFGISNKCITFAP